MEEGLQVGVGLEDGGSDEDVGVTYGFLDLLADECEEGGLGDGGWGLSGVDRAKEGRSCSIAMFGLLALGGGIDRFGVDE